MSLFARSNAKQQYTPMPRLCQEIFGFHAKIMPRMKELMFN